MPPTVIEVDKLAKQYRLGVIGAGTLRDDVQRWWHRVRGLPDPTTRVDPRRSQGAAGDAGDILWALREASFTVQQGEVLGIIGRNGAGKSTLLKILSRVTAPTSGQVKVRGRIASLLEVGTGFHPELTGRENIYLNGAILGMTKAEISRKFDEIVAFSEVGRFIDTPVKRYSSGMYVRLAFAVAAHLEPEILIVDEVLAVGDAEFQRKCLGKMGQVAEAGRTVLFVSHNMPAVQSLCTRAILLKGGSLVEDGPTADVIAKYLLAHGRDSAGSSELADHPGRVHSKEKALKRVRMLDRDGREISGVPMGGYAAFEFEFATSQPVRNPAFGFGFEDSYADRIFSLNNYMRPADGNTFPHIRSGSARMEIPCIPLMPGHYSVTVSLVEDHREWIDCVERALYFDVHPADVFNSGRIPEKSQGCVFVDGHIRVDREA